MRDAATTAPCHSPSFAARSRVATAHARRRCVRPTSATQIVKDEHPYNRCLPLLREFPRVVSMSCAVHADATRFGSSHSVAGGVLFPHGRRCELPLTFRHSPRATELVGTLPRNLGRFHRRLVKVGGCPHPETPSAGNQALTSSGAARGQCPVPFPALFRSKSVNLELDHTAQSSRNRIDPHDRSATCRFLQAAESTSTPRKPPNLAATETFSVSAACLSGCEPQSTRVRDSSRHSESVCSAGRRECQRACAHRRRGRTEPRRVPDVTRFDRLQAPG